MPAIDLKLLAIFEEVYRTRSVSEAAENLRVSQPTISIGLAKLRAFFNDPLFVRTSTGMDPTPQAKKLYPPVTESLEQLKRALRTHIVFDPRTSSRRFRVCMTDISQVVLLPELLSHLKDAAPHVRIEVLNIGHGTPSLLESGEADLAIGFIPQLEAGFYQQSLFSQRFVCMVRSDHPRIKGKLTLKQFEHEVHIQVITSGTGHYVIDKVIAQRNVKRKVALRLPNFLGIALNVARSDMIVTVPMRLGQVMTQMANVKTVDPPFALPSYAVKQHWHERYHHDPRNQWLRGVVARLFLESRKS